MEDRRPRVSSKLTILERFVIHLFVTLRFKVVADALRLFEKKIKSPPFLKHPTLLYLHEISI